MDKSRKVILASCLSIAFLAGVFACSAEEINVEKKDLFVCETQPGCMGNDGICKADANPEANCPKLKCAATKNDSCLSGSQCIAAAWNLTEGRCVLESDIMHCHDNDNDGFMGADPTFESLCGFSASSPKDCDDANSLINASATEVCDGKDNTCDGCVDGICPTTGCDESMTKLVDGGTFACNCDADSNGNTALCRPIVDLCLGAGTPESMLKVPNAVCSPKIAGVTFCYGGRENNTDGKTVFAVCETGECLEASDYTIKEGESCPKIESGKEEVTFGIYTYVYDELSRTKKDKESGIEKSAICDGQDNDCNGITDCAGIDGCGCPSTCKVTTTKCYNNGDTLVDYTTNSNYETYYKALKSKAETDDKYKKCFGVMSCEGVGTGDPFCLTESGDKLTTKAGNADCKIDIE